MVPFLWFFQTVTEVLNGSKYPTISLVLLFRTGIAGALRDSPTDGTAVKSMKQNMRMALDHRLPVEELHVIAAILDPSQRALTTVQEHLIEHDKTAVSILKEALKKYVCNLQSRQVDQTSMNETVDPTQWKKAKHELLI